MSELESSHNFIDMLGRIDRVEIVGRVRNIGSNAAWLCVCDCGNKFAAVGIQIRKRQQRAKQGGYKFEFACPVCLPRKTGEWRRNLLGLEVSELAVEPTKQRVGKAPRHGVRFVRCTLCGEVIRVGQKCPCGEKHGGQ